MFQLRVSQLVAISFLLNREVDGGKRSDTSQFVFSNETRDAPVETIIHLRQRDPVLSKSCG